MTIFVPQLIYKWLPIFCVLFATFCVLLMPCPMGTLTVVCITLLYIYAVGVWLLRIFCGDYAHNW